MVVRELITKWGFKIDDKPLQKMEQSLGSIKRTVTIVGGAALASGTALFGLAKHVANIGDEAAKSAKSIGVTAESLQALRFAAEISGVKAAGLDTGLKKFSRTLIEARRGTETYARTFRELGVAQSDINNKSLSTEDLLGKVANRFKTLKPGAEKTALAMELFGRSGADLIPLLDSGSEGINKLTQEARDLGAVMSEDDTKAAEAFNDSFTRLNAVFKGMKIAIGKDLLPVIEKAINAFKDWILANKALMKTKIDGFIKTLIKFTKTFFVILQQTFNIVQGLVNIFGGFEVVLRTVTLAMIGLVGAQSLLMIGNMVSGFLSLIKVIRTMGTAAALAQVKAFAIPILIGAALVAIGLVIEDIIAFFQGKDSVTGIMVDKFKSAFSSVTDMFNKFGTAAKIAIAVVLTPIRGLIASLRTVGNVIGALRSGKGLSGVGSALKQGFLDTVAPAIDLAQGKDMSFGSAIGLGSGTARGTSNQTTNQSTQVVNNLEVKVPEGLSPEAAADATRLGVKDALGSMLRETGRQVSSPIAE